MHTGPPPSIRATILTVTIVVIVGIPALLFLSFISWGAILLPVIGFAMLAPLCLFHYLLWGRRLSRGLKQEIQAANESQGELTHNDFDVITGSKEETLDARDGI